MLTAGISIFRFTYRIIAYFRQKQQGLITSFEPPVAYVQKEDPSVCVVELEFDLAAVFSRIYLTAHISI